MTLFLIFVAAFILLSQKTACAYTDYEDEIVDAIKNYLDSDDWKYSFDGEDKTFSFNIRIDGKLKNLRYIIFVRPECYTVYALSPVNADIEDSQAMGRMADFICRANYGLRNGNFELDMRDGELRYKTFVDCAELVPSAEVVKNSIMLPAFMFEKYSPGMLDIIFKEATAEEAIEKCEE